MKNHIIFFSGGKSSFSVADWVKTKYPEDNIVLYFTDTKWEDDDLYRFINEASDALELPMLTHADGRNPVELMFEKKLVFNSRIGDCSKILKMRVARQFLKKGIEPEIVEWRNKQYLKSEDFVTDATLYFGIGWEEMHREGPIRKNWKPFDVVMPLIDEVIDNDEVLAKYGIKVPALYEKGFAHNNCFHGEERFLTDEGVKTFNETIGTSVRVLGERGEWKDATIQSFGKQEIVELKLKRAGKTKVIKTTMGHRWFIRKSRTKRVERTTGELSAGDFLYSMYPRRRTTVKPSPIGIAQGIVFGDGTYPRSSWNNPATVTLCGEKVELLKYFPLNDRKEVKDVGIKVCDLPKSWKHIPDLSESKSFLLGWLIGYVATDGSVSKGSVTLHSSKRHELDFVQSVCLRVGIGFSEINSIERIGINGLPGVMYSMVLTKSTLRKEMMIRSRHIEGYGQEATSRPKEWEVVSVTKTGQFEDVFCAVVPDGEAFTLDSFIFTGNCKGRCVKAGMGHHRNLREQMPKVFNKLMEQEAHLSDCVNAYRYIKSIPDEEISEAHRQEMYQELDDAYRDYFYDRAESPKPYVSPMLAQAGGLHQYRKYSFMKRTRKGVVSPFQLRDLDKEVREESEQIDMQDIGGCGCFVDFDERDFAEDAEESASCKINTN